MLKVFQRTRCIMICSGTHWRFDRNTESYFSPERQCQLDELVAAFAQSTGDKNVDHKTITAMIVP